MSILNKPYEISLWEDVWNGTKFEEQKYAVIGSDTMISQSRAFNPKFVRQINGNFTLTFSIYYQYTDSTTGETINNPFINAIENLDELTRLGINTIHILPITPVGKIKAFGTAGSLYAITDFQSINPQLVSEKSSLSGIEQAKKFISECHKRNIRVIIDLPSCGAYDLYVEHPEYFAKDENQKDIIPLDWSDVRLFNAGTEEKYNEDLYNLHIKFIDFIIGLGADGLRADVAGLKPASFWKNLIKYTLLIL